MRFMASCATPAIFLLSPAASVFSGSRKNMAPPRSEDDDAAFLTILLDITQPTWRLAPLGLSPQSLAEQVLAFINSYVLLNSSNRIAVFATNMAGSYLIYEYVPPAQQDLIEAGAQLLSKLQQAMQLETETQGQQGSSLSSGLSRALCYINRVLKSLGPGASCSPRLLCITAGTDDPRQYIAVMNAIFSAQRSEVGIDCCKLGQGDSTFLQQAAYITGGTHVRPTRQAALLQYLLSAIACDPFSRQYLRLPKPSQVDFRASCFCHKRSIDIGFVCSVCLSIFCEKLPHCITCGADFMGEAAGSLKQ